MQVNPSAMEENFQLAHDIKEQEKLNERLEAQENAPVPGLAGPNHILHEAHVLITGDRNRDYGEALEDFSNQAQMWSVILSRDITPRQVAMCMIATKLCRESYRPKHDNRLDMIGYAALLEDITQEPQDE